MPAQEFTCINYEITIGEDGTGAVLTVDIDDLQELTADSEMVDVVDLTLTDTAIRTTFSHFNGNQSVVLFPSAQEDQAVLNEIRTIYGRMFVAALGDGDEPGSSKILFSRDMLLS